MPTQVELAELQKELKAKQEQEITHDTAGACVFACDTTLISTPLLYDEFNPLARRLGRRIVFLDWTNNHPERVMQRVIPSDIHQNMEKFPYFILMPHPLMQITQQSTSTPLINITLGERAFGLHSCEIQMKSLSDEDEKFSSWFKINKAEIIPVMSDNGVIVGMAHKNFLKLNFNPFMVHEHLPNITTIGKRHISQWLIQQINTIAKMESDENTPAKVEREVQKYREFNKTAQEVRSNELLVQAEKLARAQRDHYVALQQNEKELTKLHSTIRSLKRKGGFYSATLLKPEFNKMMEEVLKKYKRFEYASSGIIGYTRLVKIKYCGDEFKIGEFKVSMNFNGEVLIHNLTDRKDNGSDHPHVSEGIACWGNVKELVVNLIHAGDFLGFFMAVHDYLSSYNHESPYTPVSAPYGWGSDDTWCESCEDHPKSCGCEDVERCEHCEHPVDDCQCEHCEHCERLEDDCNCDRCETCDEKEPDCTCEEEDTES